jgi:Methyltransferase domain
MLRMLDEEIQVFCPQRVRNGIYHWAGAGILALNSLRHRIRGYRTPRPRGTSRLKAALEYDRAVFDNWLRHYLDYFPHGGGFQGRRVLEIGPGPDLGTGLLCLAAGASSYTAIDAHRLVTRRTGGVHADLATLIASDFAHGHERLELQARLLHSVEALHTGEPDRLSYHHLPDFNLEALEGESFDLVVSHSALEHLAKPRHTLTQLTALMSERAHLVAEIDLQTHTRWIRDADPLNIYRYNSQFYEGLRFSGSPNRFRPDEYLEALESEDWVDLRIYPQRVLEPGYVERIEPSLDAAFRGDLEHMGWMTIVLCASRSGERSWKKLEESEA